MEDAFDDYDEHWPGWMAAGDERDDRTAGVVLHQQGHEATPGTAGFSLLPDGMGREAG